MTDAQGPAPLDGNRKLMVRNMIQRALQLPRATANVLVLAIPPELGEALLDPSTTEEEQNQLLKAKLVAGDKAAPEGVPLAEQQEPEPIEQDKGVVNSPLND